MGVIQIDLFTTLDGVAQAPGAPDEDTEGGFEFGGWQAPVADEVIGEQVVAGIAKLDALLLGRKTYDIFAAYWPHQTNEIAEVFNRVPKYVASRGNPTLAWDGSTLLGPDLAGGAQGARSSRERARQREDHAFVVRRERGPCRVTRLGAHAHRVHARSTGLLRRRRASQPHPHRAGGHLAEGHGDVALRPCRRDPRHGQHGGSGQGSYLRNLLVVLSAAPSRRSDTSGVVHRVPGMRPGTVSPHAGHAGPAVRGTVG